MKIVSSCDEDGAPVVSPSFVEDVEKTPFVDPDNELAAKKLQQTLDTLYVHNPIPIKDLLELEEKIEIHQEFNDESFIQAATEIKNAENEITVQPLTRKEQLDILHGALRIVDKRIDDGDLKRRS
ncbi:9121_t:CDS:2 [Racocetra fulgida]|uniref:9121_t:CDS:1 n=1 Tax=Racocetra fulgida TaxID=60492 RepID=A0A9N9C371_9GLOM|nr:9121_t:CDS:2 [Racocetra fulgida]